MSSYSVRYHHTAAILSSVWDGKKPNQQPSSYTNYGIAYSVRAYRRTQCIHIKAQEHSEIVDLRQEESGSDQETVFGVRIRTSVPDDFQKLTGTSLFKITVEDLISSSQSKRYEPNSEEMPHLIMPKNPFKNPWNRIRNWTISKNLTSSSLSTGTSAVSKVFVKFRSLLFRKVANTETNKQTDRQTNRQIDGITNAGYYNNLLGGDNNVIVRSWAGFCSSGGQIHRRSQDFLCGCTFFPKKADDLFSRRPQNTGHLLNELNHWTTLTLQKL